MNLWLYMAQSPAVRPCASSLLAALLPLLPEDVLQAPGLHAVLGDGQPPALLPAPPHLEQELVNI